MARETRTKDKYRYYRKKIRHPFTGEYKDVYGHTKQERDEKADALMAQWIREAELAESPFFWEYAAGWYSRAAVDMSKRRRETIAREINNNLCPVIGSKRLLEITSDDCQAVLAARGAISESARALTLQTMKRILEAAVDAGKLPKNPARSLEPGGTKGKKRKAPTPAQQERLLEAVRGLKIDLFVRMGLYTGLRREELCGLLWADVELSAAAPCLHVRRACRWPKNSWAEISGELKSPAAYRTVPLPEILAAELRARRSALGDLTEDQIRARCVIGNDDGTPWSMSILRKAWRGIEVRTAGEIRRRRKDPVTGKTVAVVEYQRLGDAVFRHPGVYVSLDFECTPHILRHTYITRLILGGVDVKRAQYLAGHETPDVTLEIYTELMGNRPEDLIGPVRKVFD